MKVLKNASGRVIGFEMTEREYERLSGDYAGLCVRCGAEAYGCEPDAERYECEDCERPAVYGIEQLAIMGGIQIVEHEFSELDHSERH